MTANNACTIPAPALDRPTIPAPPSVRDLRPTLVAPPEAALLVDCCRPDLRLPSDALAQAALAVVRDAVEAEVDAMFAEPGSEADECSFHANGGEGRCAYCER